MPISLSFRDVTHHCRRFLYLQYVSLITHTVIEHEGLNVRCNWMARKQIGFQQWWNKLWDRKGGCLPRFRWNGARLDLCPLHFPMASMSMMRQKFGDQRICLLVNTVPTDNFRPISYKSRNFCGLVLFKMPVRHASEVYMHISRKQIAYLTVHQRILLFGLNWGGAKRSCAPNKWGTNWISLSLIHISEPTRPY